MRAAQAKRRERMRRPGVLWAGSRGDEPVEPGDEGCIGARGLPLRRAKEIEQGDDLRIEGRRQPPQFFR
jgi:hypothetical protein